MPDQTLVTTEPSLTGRLALEQALASRAFEKTPTLRSLLIYLWAQRQQQISEYAIATEALGRPSYFDPKTDATVRVQIGRLRQRLELFYDREGADLPQRLIIPVGSHQLQIRTEAVMPEAASDLVGEVQSAPVLISSPRKHLFRRGEVKGKERLPKLTALLWAALTLALVVLCGYQGYVLRSRSYDRARLAIPPFWQRFFSNGRATRVVLPTPVFFSFDVSGKKDGHSLMFRDTEVNDFASGLSSVLFRRFAEQNGPPALGEMYTVTSDTFAAVQLTRYFDAHGVYTSLYSAADATLEALDEENVIAMGTWGTLTPLKPYLDRMDFRLSTHESSVYVAHRSQGEPVQVTSYSVSGERSVWPGIIAFLPAADGRSRLLLLAGRHTATLVSVLTTTIGLQQVEHLWKLKGAPDYFELVVNAEMRGRTLVRCWPVALHPFRN